MLLILKFVDVAEIVIIVEIAKVIKIVVKCDDGLAACC